MSDRPSRSSPLGLAVAALLAVAAGGCMERLAQRHAHFTPLSEQAAATAAQTERILRYQQAAQAARRACDAPAPAAAHALGADAAARRLCASAGRPRAAHGGLSNAYDRWVAEEVRELPAPSETGSSVGGGS